MTKAKKTMQGWPVGRTITQMRPLAPAELALMGWSEPTAHEGPNVVLILDDGTRLIPQRDAEGNGPGVLAGAKGDGDVVLLAAAPSGGR